MSSGSAERRVVHRARRVDRRVASHSEKRAAPEAVASRRRLARQATPLTGELGAEHGHRRLGQPPAGISGARAQTVKGCACHPPQLGARGVEVHRVHESDFCTRSTPRCADDDESSSHALRELTLPCRHECPARGQGSGDGARRRVMLSNAADRPQAGQMRGRPQPIPFGTSARPLPNAPGLRCLALPSPEPGARFKLALTAGTRRGRGRTRAPATPPTPARYLQGPRSR
mmetsp:Transcript_8857/g.34777  ORF Transcript_8857/g.34777 Transcript_8857/m.34777 type:complete len:230 (-) Transcript_8857:114-803(-)